MPKASDVLSQIGNFWELVPAEDKVAIRTLYTGYQMALSDLLLRAYQIDQAKSIRTIQPAVKREWYYIDISYTNASTIPGSYSIETEIHKIPELQQGIYKEGVILKDTIDYVVTQGLITFISPAARDVVDPVINLYDTIGTKNKAGVYVLDQNAAGLTGSDYVISGDQKTVRLKTKLAFDTFAGLTEGSVLKALQDRVLWAADILIDEELVYRNFGVLMDFPRTGSGYSLETYTRIVKGLWFIHWNGPTPNNIRNGLSLIFDYPTSPVKGKVTRIRFTAAPVFLAHQLPNGITTIFYSKTIPVGSDLPVTFSYVSGTLPPGYAIDTVTGTVSGTTAFPGTYSFVVQAANSRGFTNQTIIIVVDGPPVFVSTTLPNAALNEFYTFTLNISTIIPYTLAVLSGSLPPGISLTPELKKLAGTPTANGVFLFTLRSTNQGGQTDQAFSLTVVAVAPDSGSIGPEGGGGLPDGLVD